MREEESGRPQTSPSSSSGSISATNFSVKKEGSKFEGLFGRGKYKLWALAAITLLALWSMFTGTVTLKWSDVNLQPSQDLDPSVHGDLDILVHSYLLRDLIEFNFYLNSRLISCLLKF